MTKTINHKKEKIFAFKMSLQDFDKLKKLAQEKAVGISTLVRMIVVEAINKKKIK